MGLKIPIPKSFQIPIWEYPILNNGSKFEPFQSKRDICEIPILILNSFQLLNIPVQQLFFVKNPIPTLNVRSNIETLLIQLWKNCVLMMTKYINECAHKKHPVFLHET